jgi:hypothetical protein
MAIIPLRANGHRLYTGNTPFEFRGAVICCTEPFAKQDGWPLLSAAATDYLSSFGVNWTHIRTGPFTYEGEGPGFEGIINGEINQTFLSRIRETVSYAQARGIYVEVDLFDEWVIEHGLSPFSQDGVGCGVFRKPPSGLVKQWIVEVIRATSVFSNVTYQISNESFDCDVRPDFEIPVAQLVQQLAPGHLVATNSHRPDIESSGFIDGVNKHQEFVLPNPLFNRPSIVNEYQNMAPDTFKASYKLAKEFGTYFVAWRGEANPKEWEEMLKAMR